MSRQSQILYHFVDLFWVRFGKTNAPSDLVKERGVMQCHVGVGPGAIVTD